MSSQKEVFLASEGDAWFSRNRSALEARDWSSDRVCVRIAALAAGRKLSVLEVGCGEGSRLRYLAAQGHRVAGVDPSAKAVARACEQGIGAKQATADALPFDSSAFDVVIFGFCLYLCDTEDLFRIAQEADRVLANPGWLIILDFETPSVSFRPYHHAPQIRSRKMDYKSMFLWHPAYTLAAYEKSHHESQEWTDEAGEWVSLSCLRKHLAP
jgi:SAM-dependent methyltransferase